ncbi:hypothetical protein HPP92_020394 [Vanilla planifolia]|uniref:Uncharacterized protein n=1 Tax=Vanilla planifolia TaxID=51239 RepID=A0A835UHU6_VANPL|nr:hypothetical protein HPP92_020394 [Vanilla planifolia]
MSKTTKKPNLHLYFTKKKIILTSSLIILLLQDIRIVIFKYSSITIKNWLSLGLVGRTSRKHIYILSYGQTNISQRMYSICFDVLHCMHPRMSFVASHCSLG